MSFTAEDLRMEAASQRIIDLEMMHPQEIGMRAQEAANLLRQLELQQHLIALQKREIAKLEKQLQAQRERSDEVVSGWGELVANAQREARQAKAELEDNRSLRHALVQDVANLRKELDELKHQSNWQSFLAQMHPDATEISFEGAPGSMRNEFYEWRKG